MVIKFGMVYQPAVPFPIKVNKLHFHHLLNGG